jgi:serine protease
LRAVPAAVAVVGLVLATALHSPRHPAVRAEAAVQPGAHAPGTLLVRFREGVPPARAASLLRRRRATLGGRIGATTFFRVTTSRPLARLAGELRADASVGAVALDYARRAAGGPNDPLWIGDVHLYSQQALRQIGLPDAWELSRGSPSEALAIVDTGVDLLNPEIAPHLAPGLNVLDPGKPPQDTSGHGTMLAGIVAATPDNGIGIAGVAWNATIIPVKVMSAGSRAVASDSDIAAGITWAADHGARVMLLAFAGSDDSPVLREAVAHALSRDVVVVAAAGASAAPGERGLSRPMYPAALPGVVAVTATAPTGVFAPTSNFGPWVDLAAPGVVLPTTCLAGICAATGTSYAAAVVAGVVLLLRAQHPDWPAARVVARIEQSAADRGAPGTDPYYGHGLVDALAALGAPRSAPESPVQAAATWTDPFPFGDRATAVGAAPDAFEPNDLPSRATVVAGHAPATFGAEGDVDWYAIDVSIPGTIDVTVTPPPGGRLPSGFISRPGQGLDSAIPAFEIYDPELRPLAERDGAAFVPNLQAVAARPGRYLLRVRNTLGSRAPYTLDVDVTRDPAVTFGPPLLVQGSGPSSSVIVADVTGDGRADLVGASRGTPAQGSDPGVAAVISVFAQNPDGTLADPVRLASSARSYYAPMAAGDLDGDGAVDLVAATQAGIEVYWHRGSGLAGPALIAGSPACSALVTADLDADGRAEILCDGWRLVVLEATSTGFSRQELGPYTGPAALIAAGDVNGDGRTDIVQSAYGHLFTYVQRTDGGFDGNEADLSADGSFWGLAVADLTGDGRPDVLVGRPVRDGTGARILRFTADANGILGPATAIADTLAREPSIRAADLNGDGRLDLVVGPGTAAILLQRPDGTLLGQRFETGVMGGNEASLAIGDLNGDGRPDLAGGGADGPVVLPQRTPSSLADRPWIEDATPADRAGDVALDAAATLTFVREMDAPSISALTVRLTDGDTGDAVPAGVAYDAGSRTAILRPDAPLAPFTPYLVTVEGVRDAGGAVLTEPASLRFRTRAVLRLLAVGSRAVAGEPFVGVVGLVPDPAPRGRAGDYSATVSWGAGASAAAVVSADEQGFRVTATHVYAEPGEYPVTVRVAGPAGQVAEAVAVARVDAPPPAPRQEEAPSQRTTAPPTFREVAPPAIVPPAPTQLPVTGRSGSRVAQPKVSGLRLLPARIRTTRKGRPIRVTMRFVLSARAQVRIELRRVGSRRLVAVSRQTGRRGLNRMTVTAALSPGRYNVLVRPGGGVPAPRAALTVAGPLVRR